MSFNLPIPSMGRNTEETIDNLIDTMLIYRKELNYLMKNLSLDNMPMVGIVFNEVEDELYQTKTLIAQTANQIMLEVSDKVGIDEVISRINLSSEGIAIIGQRIALEGTVTANGNFMVNTDGTIYATNAYLAGEIQATQGKIADFNITDNSISGDNVGISQGGLRLGTATIGVHGSHSVDMNCAYLYLGDWNRDYVGITWNQGPTGTPFVSAYGTQYGIYSSEPEVTLYVNKIDNIYNTPFEISTTTSNIDLKPAKNIYVYGDMRPGGSYNLGSSTLRWDTVYLENQPNVSSDVRHKEEIGIIPDEIIEVLKEIRPKMYKQGDKWHFGYIAQDVERALYKYSLDRVGFKEAKNEIEKFAVLYKDESYMSLLYGELNVLKEAEIQDRINDLENRIKVLEGDVNGD